MRPTRRQFLACACALLVQPAPAVRLRIAGAGRGMQGAELALQEMERTAALIGRRLERADDADAMLVDVTRGALTVADRHFHVRAGDQARAAAIRSWRDDHPGSDAHAAVEWHESLVRYGAEQLNERFRRRFARGMDADAWVGWMLVKVAVESELRGIPVAEGRYDGHKGAPLTFGGDGRLVHPLCIVNARGDLLGVIE